MAKSFCSGCRHWKLYRPEPYSSIYNASDKFHYCDLLETWELRKRKELCNDKYKEK